MDYDSEPNVARITKEQLEKGKLRQASNTKIDIPTPEEVARRKTDTESRAERLKIENLNAAREILSRVADVMGNAAEASMFFRLNAGDLGLNAISDVTDEVRSLIDNDLSLYGWTSSWIDGTDCLVVRVRS